MSIKSKRWIIADAPNKSEVEQLINETNLNTIVAGILVQRGIKNLEQAKVFFRPDSSQLHDPFLMKDMDKAVARLIKAINHNERILIYGDYDVDGTTSVTLVYVFLSTFYSNLDIYNPDRYLEGYGISTQGIDYAAETGCSLIIALDCGIKAVEKVQYAAAKGIDFIICDHHLPGSVLPEAVAVLDPKREDCLYPYKELSGCGVGFKLMQALHQQGFGREEDLHSLFDLLAVSICSDIVPITGENRTLCYLGFKKLIQNPRPSLQALLAASGHVLEDGSVKPGLTVSDIVFGVGPRINAAGRIGHASDAVKLLISNDNDLLNDLATFLNKQNADRQEFDSSITQEATEILEATPFFDRKLSTVVFKQDWHKGVIGIVASRLVEKFYKPTVVLTSSNGKITGSARSVEGFDLYAAIDACGHVLEQYGGHAHAAGLTLNFENLENFRQAFEEEVSKRITEDMLQPCIIIDMELPLAKISYSLFKTIQLMQPFGPGNMQPVFMAKAVQDNGMGRLLAGKKGTYETVKLFLTHPDCVHNGKPYSIEAIGFGLGETFKSIQPGALMDICYTIEENNFNGRTSLQLVLKDLKPHVAQDF
jgi:single-stranded-DNA-specific exonuclease